MILYLSIYIRILCVCVRERERASVLLKALSDEHTYFVSTFDYNTS